MINQLANKTKSMSELIKSNESQKLYEEMCVAVLMVDDFDSCASLLEQIITKNYQLRY